MTEVQQSLYTRAMEQQHAICKCIKDAELVCTHPWCYATRASVEERSQLPQQLLGEAEDQAVSDSSKMEELFRILRGLLQCRQKVLLFFCRTITSDLVAARIGPLALGVGWRYRFESSRGSLGHTHRARVEP